MKKIMLFVWGSALCLGLERNVSTLSGDFTQYIEQEQIRYGGTFVFKAPNLAKWEYTQPIQKSVYIKGDILISFEPMLEQAIYRKIEKELNLLSIIAQAKQDKKDPNLYLAEIDGVLYRLYTENQKPKALEYEDALGNTIVIEMKNVKINAEVDLDVFEFKPSANIDIVRE